MYTPHYVIESRRIAHAHPSPILINPEIKFLTAIHSSLLSYSKQKEGKEAPSSLLESILIVGFGRVQKISLGRSFPTVSYGTFYHSGVI